MRLILYGVTIALCLLLPVASHADEAKNNFEHFYALTGLQETELGVISVPQSARQVAEHRGVAIIETASRPFSLVEIAQIKTYLDRVPAKMMETPPKAIIASSGETRASTDHPTAIAGASGPYIFLGDRFFKNSFLRKRTENDRLHAFMHEFGHVLQYYHLDIEHGTQRSIDTSSSLIHDFSVAVGWVARDDLDGVFLSGQSISFVPDITEREWVLTESAKGGTTEYGQTSNSEDLAESFGWVLAGHPDRISRDRRDFILAYLGEIADAFTKGIIPVHPESVRVRQPRRTERFYQGREPPGFVSTDEDDGVFNYIDGEKSIPFADVAAYYAEEFLARSYAVVQDMKIEAIGARPDYASAVYAYRGKQVLVQILEFSTGSVTIRTTVS